MIRKTIREWEYLIVDDSGVDDTISRTAANHLLESAQSHKIGGADGESILINGHKRLRAQQVVGLLVAPGVTLEILPKIDELGTEAVRHHLVHMLARVSDIDIVSSGMTELGWQSKDILEILIRMFADRLFETLRRGLPRRYIQHEEDLPTFRGRLDILRQFTVHAVAPQKLACRYEDLSSDIALNQVMKAAVTRLLGLARSVENQRRLKELSFVYADITLVPINAVPWDRVVMDRTNTAWTTLLNLAKLLLGERFQTTSAGGQQGFSLMFEMNTLFEEYIGLTLRRALAGSVFNVRLQGPRSHALVSGNAARWFATKPDIVISLGDQPVLIIDTKWKRLTGALDDPKRGVGQNDVYQMMAYAQVYQCGRLILLYPHHQKLGVGEGLLSTYHIQGTEDAQLSVASVSLTDLGGIGERLKAMVFQKLGLGTELRADAA